MRLPRQIVPLLATDLRRHTATLLTGSGLAAAIAIGVQPVLTRLYSPSDFGITDAFVAVVAVVLPFASLKYEDALMVPESDRDASVLLLLSFGIALVFSLILLVLSPLRVAVASALGSPALSPWLVLVPLALLLYRTSELAELWVSRAKNFAAASTSTVVRAASSAGVRVGWALVLPGTILVVDQGPGGLIWGFIAGFAASVAFLVVPRLSSVGRAIALLSDAELLATARRFVNFPRFGMPAGVIAAVAQALPYFLLLYFFDEATVGYFGRSFAVIAIPLSMIGSAVSRTFFVHAADANRAGTLSAIASRVHARMVMFAMFPALATLVAGPELFEVVFGEGWRIAGEYARATVVWFALVGISSPLTRIFDVTERQRTELVVSAVICVALAVAFTVGGRTGDPLLAILAGSIGGAIGRLIQLSMTMRIASVGISALLTPYIRYAAYAVPGVAIMLAATRVDTSTVPIAVLAATLTGGILYALFALHDLRKQS